MYVPDLATACDVATGEVVRAIGWLERGKPFATGRAEPRFVAALRSHVDDVGKWLPVMSPGVHFCDLGGCQRAWE
jgi:hypothetical protein